MAAWTFLVFLLGVSTSPVSGEPDWGELCDCSPELCEGHEYFFSDIELNWVEAVAECALYGDGDGLVYLARIESRLENNCLLQHASQRGKQAWWWHSGNLFLSPICSKITFYFFVGNDIETEGVYRFLNGSQLAWKADWARDEPNGMDSDGLMLSSYDDHTAGAWADAATDSSYRSRFICETDK